MLGTHQLAPAYWAGTLLKRIAEGDVPESVEGAVDLVRCDHVAVIQLEGVLGREHYLELVELLAEISGSSVKRVLLTIDSSGGCVEKVEFARGAVARFARRHRPLLCLVPRLCLGPALAIATAGLGLAASPVAKLGSLECGLLPTYGDYPPAAEMSSALVRIVNCGGFTNPQTVLLGELGEAVGLVDLLVNPDSLYKRWCDE